MTDYYQLELDDMVIALNNKDTEIKLLQKKFDIAVKALEKINNPTIGDIYNKSTDEIDYNLVTNIAHDSLKEIDLVGKEFKMTWEELVEKAKKLGYELYYEDDLCYLENKNIDLSFFEDGQIEYMYGGIISEGRTPEQMFEIMKALQ